MTWVENPGDTWNLKPPGLTGTGFPDYSSAQYARAQKADAAFSRDVVTRDFVLRSTMLNFAGIVSRSGRLRDLSFAIAACLFSTMCGANSSHPGEEDYRRVCSDCHDKGADKNRLSKGAPRKGDRTAWESQVRKGIESTFKAMMNARHHGKRDDPSWEKANPFIWRDDLTDEQIRVALEYMFAQVTTSRAKRQ